ncbi:uncharacterized protein LDX57_003985 [Aspergillus melleus]|uniref:uncharacterized protein n=1 Tax=Aspergillus melleus TaxID=138277 RepID=UPI001E8D9E09|nr:uncharacterized protein LDX57_003985 [Aspergillus melleus]KAH8426239.1 hypothetical protein LDX57_003985 [Aspergillus melleus]
MGMDFVFINVREPKDALQLAKEPEIRSHVARYQWKQIENRSSHSTQKEGAEKARDKRPWSTCIELDCSAPHDQDGLVSDTTTRPPKPFDVVQPAISIPPPLGGIRVDPFRSYPISFRPFLPQLVDHYLMSMAVDIPELDQPGNRGLLRTSWFPLVMTEPSLFLVIMLLAGSHYASVRDPSADIKLDLLRLRCETVNAINYSLQFQQKDGVNDALVGAIAKMASYEAMFGNMENYSVHMRGLTRAVGLRGGLTSLGLNGLLRRIVVWIDRNAAFLHGSSLYFPGATFVPGQALPDPNPGHFLGAS